MAELKDTLATALGSNFSIERELGGGGMSRVFVAQDRGLQRTVVVKVLHSELAAEVSTERFRREVQLAARLQHPHIVPLIASGEVEGLPYFIMPFINGESLQSRIGREGELPIKEAVRILRDIASALAHAHRHGIVHRDIKPDNILLSEDFAVVTDFGIAKALNDSVTAAQPSGLTTRGVALGTVAYMAPEQAAADPSVDQRADIYSFGVVAYEILTGCTPFAGRSTQAILAAHAVQAPESIDKRRPGIPPLLASLVMQCLEKRPADRPQNSAALLAALESIPTSGAMTAHTPDRRSDSDSPRVSRRWAWIAAAGAVAIIGAYSAYRYVPRATVTPPVSDASSGSIAVLPLTNFSGNSEDEYFSEGMTDELANALSKIPNLNVASRTSTYSFKGRKDLNLAEVGKKLNVRTVVEGSVRRSGERLRVYAQLTDIANGFVLWSKTFDGDTRDVFRFQDQIAAAVADALRSRLALNTAGAPAGARGTQDLRAYDLYLRGRYFWHQRGGANLANAVNYFKSALEQDPKFARAYAGLAIAQALLPEYSAVSPELSTRLAIEAADRALALDTSLAEAYTAKGLAYTHAWEREKAAAEYQRAIQIDPRYPTAHQWYGEYWLQRGEIDSALKEISRAVQLDPLAPINASALGYTLTLAGRHDEAIAELKRGIELTPTLGQQHGMLANAYFAKGVFDSAFREADIAVRLDSAVSFSHGQTALMAGKNGNKPRAVEELRYLRTRFGRPPIPRYAMLLAYLGVGDHKSALDELEAGVKERDMTLGSQSLEMDPLMADIRNEPRFRKVVERMAPKK